MRLSCRPTATARTGFTLVELMVATALIILILSILTVAFHTGIDSFRQLKAVGDMSEGLRAAEAVIRRDLAADHLEDPNGNAIRISDPAFGIPGNTLYPGVNWHGDGSLGGLRGRKGYFQVRQVSPPMQIFNPALASPPYLPMVSPWDTPNARETYPYLFEGTEDNIPSFRATDHSVAFTVRQKGRNAQEVFAADAPNGQPPYPGAPAPYTDMTRAPLSLEQFTDRANPQFVSRWAEVAYFLKPSGILTSGDDGSSSLAVYTLYRRVRVLSPSTVAISPPPPGTPTYSFDSPQNGNYYRERYPELSIATTMTPGGTSVVNTPETVNQPVDFGGQTIYPGRTDTIVDWRNSGGTATPVVRLVPAGVAETAQSQPAPATPVPYDGTVANAERYGSDVVLNNVLSFHVQVLTDASTAANGWWLDPGTGAWPRVYDTAASTARVKAIRMKIRVYDTKMKQTRQVTIIQDL